MAIQIQNRRGTTTAHNTFTGALGEVTIDTTKNTAVVHDGVTPGGHPLKKASDTVMTSVTGVSGNIAFVGSGNRITGDFSNATIANRVMFQTSTVNGQTVLAAIPNGTSVTAGFVANSSSSDTANASEMLAAVVGSSDVRFSSGIRGTGAYLPMTFYTGGAERMRIDTSGNVLVTSAAGLGYGVGSGGSATQATSKDTTVTVTPAKPTGRITMNAAAMAGGASNAFTVANSLVSASDLVLVNVVGFNSYNSKVVYSFAGGFVVEVANRTGGSLSEAVTLNFAIIKGNIS